MVEMLVSLLVIIICLIGALLGLALVLTLVGVTIFVKLGRSLVRWMTEPGLPSANATNRLNSQIRGCHNDLCRVTNPIAAQFCHRCGQPMGTVQRVTAGRRPA